MGFLRFMLFDLPRPQFYSCLGGLNWAVGLSRYNSNAQSVIQKKTSHQQRIRTMAHIIFNDFPALKDTIPLGRLVPSIYSLKQDYCDPDPAIPANSIQATPVSNIQAVLEHNKSRNFRISLLRFLRSSTKDSVDEELQLEGVSSKSYVLSHPIEEWGRICSRPKIREWLNTMIHAGSKVYMVVGIQTVVDATIRVKNSKRTASGLSAVVANEISAHVETVLGNNTTGSSNTQVSYHTVGERIYAVCLRKIHFRWYSPKAVGTIKPGDNIWQVPCKTRGTTAAPMEPRLVEPILDGENSEIKGGVHFVTYEGYDGDDDEGDSEDESELEDS